MRENMRFKSYDIAKYIAIVLVVWGHFLQNCASSLWDILGLYINACHMPVFFFISGVFLYKELNRDSFGAFSLRKIKRLLIPYLIWSGISWSFHAALIVMNTGKADALASLASEAAEIFLYARSVWFLLVLFLSSEIYGLCFALHRRRNIPLLPLLLAVYAVSIVALPNELFRLFKLKWLFLFLILGYYWSKHGLNRKTGKRFNRILLCVGIPAYIGLCSCATDWDRMQSMFKVSLNQLDVSRIVNGVVIQLCGIVGIIAIMSLSNVLADGRRGSDALTLRGQFTLDVYVIHMFFLMVIKAFVPGGMSYVQMGIVSLLASVLIIELIILVSRLFLKKLPLYRVSIGISAGAPDALRRIRGG